MSADKGFKGFDRNYRRGAVMGLTVAEAFILLAFCLLLLFAWWQIDTESRSLDVTEKIGQMTAQEKREIAAAIADGSVERILKLREEGIDLTSIEENKKGIADAIADGAFDRIVYLRTRGVDLAGPKAQEETERYSRFMQEAELQRLLQGAAALKPGTNLKLADLVALGDDAKILAALQAAAASTSDNPIRQISDRLSQAAEAERKLVETLNEKLGASVRAAGGEIDASGTIILPESVLFDPGRDRIKDPKFLVDFCGPWIDTLKSSDLEISDVKIEGHASSEGPKGSNPDTAYRYNLDLSQRRAQNALNKCLDGVETTDALLWARGHLAAIGYSSTRPISQPDGTEDKERSRRVMFSVSLDRSRLIEGIGRDVKRSFKSSGRHVSGVPRIVDGDTLEVSHTLIGLYGVDAPEVGQVCEDFSGKPYDCGELAKENLTEILGDGAVNCEVESEDQYDRLVSRCILDDKDIAAEMVRDGFAVPFERYSEDYISVGLDAQANKVGLWAGKFQMPWDVRNATGK
jgi:endonuclease YncB( thermonuclease family)